MIRNRLGIFLIGSLLLAPACKAPATPPPAEEEQRLVFASRTRASLTLRGRTFTIRRTDNLPLGDLAIAIGDKVYPAQAGSFKLPAAALDEAARGGIPIAVIGRGVVPRLLPASGDGELVLIPAIERARSQVVPSLGGSLSAGDHSIAALIPPGTVAAPAEVALALYVPPLPAPRASAELRDAVLAQRGQPAGSACDAPLPCPPPRHALGVLLTVDGPATPGTPIPVTLSLTALMKGWNGTGNLPKAANDWSETERQAALAAAAIRDTFARVDATGDGAWRAAIAAEGIVLDGDKLTLTLPFEAGRPAGGNVVVALASATLGVYFELTLVSAQAGSLPAVLAPPVPSPGPGSLPAVLPSANGLPGGNLPGGSLPVDPGLPGGAPIVSNNSGSLMGLVRLPLISDMGGSLISNNGGNLAKYRLLAYADDPAAGAQVGLVDAGDVPQGATVVSDGAGGYSLTGVPNTPPAVFVRAIKGPATARALGNSASINLDAATTAITCWVLDEVRKGNAGVAAISEAGYQADVSFIRPVLDQGQAYWVVHNSVPAVADLVRVLFANAGRTPGSLPIAIPPAAYRTGAQITAVTIAGLRSSIAVDPKGPVWTTAASGVVKVSPEGAILNTLTIPLGNYAGVGRDPNGDLWITSNPGTTVTKISDTGVVAFTYAVGEDPQEVGFTPGFAWIVNRGRNAVPATDTVTKVQLDGTPDNTYDVGGSPWGIAVDGNNDVWVSNSGDVYGPDGVTRLSSAGAMLGNFAAGKKPRGIAIDRGGNVWTADVEDNTVTKLLPSGAIAGSYSVPLNPHGLAIDHQNRVWVTSRDQGTVSCLGQDGTVIGTYPVGSSTTWLAVDGAGFIWVTDASGKFAKLAF